MARPSIKSPCNADRYLPKNGPERIAEFSGQHGGGLINVRNNTDGRQRTVVSVYRCDATVEVSVGQDDHGKQTPVWVSGKRVPDIRALRDTLEGLATKNAGSVDVVGADTRKPPLGRSGNHVLVRYEDWEALVVLRAFIDGEG